MLTNEDKLLLNKMFLLSNKIFKLYNTLYELEINNQKNSNLYLKNLKYLNLLIDIENDLYKNIPYKKIELYLEYSDRAKLFKKIGDLTLITRDFYELYIYKRVYNRLQSIENSFFIEKYQNSNIEKKEPYYDKATILYQIINEDFFRSLIFEADIKSQEINNKDYKNNFILLKYIISFLNKNIETNYLNNFKVEDQLIINNKAYSDMININPKDYDRIISNYYFNNIYLELKNIINIVTNDYKIMLYNLIIKAYMNINPNYIYLKNIIYDIINTNSNLIELNVLNHYRDNVSILRSERLVLNGNSK